ncbi:MAG: hypothetical protein CMF98_03690 [Candidatus Marinimicrobia bacterium]|nr:hypothetical protein [Candidatus Neomarinimicrobiota bacterium]OUW50585.1 MAG: hypothetical protein CBD50_02285 [bacterium TMED190]|tara:strand:- start:143504 stop:144043 length:540 start_codon:yes stop_codon:yes gene_type:complete
MPSTVELIQALIETHEQLSLDDCPDEYKNVLIEQEKLITNEIMNKSDSIHWFLTQIDIEENKLNSTIEIHQRELEKLKKKRLTIDRSKDKMKELIMTVVDKIGVNQENGNKILKTDNKKYTIYETDGPLELIDENKIPDRYFKTERKLNRSLLRNDVKKTIKKEEEYAKVSKIKRLKIS